MTAFNFSSAVSNWIKTNFYIIQTKVILLFTSIQNYSFISTTYNSMNDFLDSMKRKLVMLRICLQHHLYVSAMVLIFIMILDIYDPLLNVSLLSRWVLPHKLQYLKIPVLTFRPLLLLFESQQHETLLWIYRFNIGPMLTLWMSRSIKHYLEVFSYRNLLPFIDCSKAEFHLPKRSARTRDARTPYADLNYIFPIDGNDIYFVSNLLSNFAHDDLTDTFYENA
jgi:hypothetical protein